MKLALFSDVHGHLRLVLHLIRNWQIAHATQLDAALIAGDLGCFPDPSKFDRATKRWVERDSEEAGFSKYFTSPLADVEQMFGGRFGVQCPILFVPGNHEDYDHIRSASAQTPAPDAPANTFPVDCYKRFHCVRDGAVIEVYGQDKALLRIAGIWGIENAHAGAPYRINAGTVEQLMEQGMKSFDLLLTHDAPAEAYPDGGSALITRVIRSCQPSIHLFGHVHPIGETYEFSLLNCPTKSCVLKGVSFETCGRNGLIGSIGILDWDGSTAKVETVRDQWLWNMRPDNCEQLTPQCVSHGEDVAREKRQHPLISDADYRRILQKTFGIEWAAISELPEADRRAALARIDELQGESPRDRAWPTEGGNEPAPEPGWDPSGTFRPDVVRRVYEELKAAGKIK